MYSKCPYYPASGPVEIEMAPKDLHQFNKKQHVAGKFVWVQRIMDLTA